MGCAIQTILEFTKPQPLPGRRGTLHPYILDAMAVSPTDGARLAELKALGISKIDLVVANTTDPELLPKPTAEELMEQLSSQVQIGGASLLRWAGKHTGTPAPLGDPQDYRALVADLSRPVGKLSQPESGI